MSEQTKEFGITPGDAIRYLAETDAEEAAARAQVEYWEEKIKETRADAYLNVQGSTVDERKSRAEISQYVKEAKGEYIKALQAQKELYNKRKTCELIIAMWQTKSANSRRGNIV